MRPKVMIWLGVGIIIITLGILITWAALAGYLPKIQIDTSGIKITDPRLDIKALNLLDLVTRAITVPLQLFAGALQITMGQVLNAFKVPGR
jgi:hypothetical protein